jgi:hypothetical protein
MITATDPLAALAQGLVAVTDMAAGVVALTGRPDGNLLRGGDDGLREVGAGRLAYQLRPVRPAGSVGRSYLGDVSLLALAPDDERASALLEAAFAAQTPAAFLAAGLDAVWYGKQERAIEPVTIAPNVALVEATLTGTIWFTLP